MFGKTMTRTGMWVLCVFAVAVLAPTAAAAEYGSEQKSVRSHSLSCGHLGKSCEGTQKAKKAAKKGKRNKRVRRSCKARGSVRAYAAVPRSNRHAQAARCRR